MTGLILLAAAVLFGADAASKGPMASPAIVESHSPAISEQGALVETVGIGLEGDAFSSLLVAGCKMPCEGLLRIDLIRRRVERQSLGDDQTTVSLELFRGTLTKKTTATHLGTFQVRGLPALPRGQNGRLFVRLFVEGQDLKIEAFASNPTQFPYQVIKVETHP